MNGARQALVGCVFVFLSALLMVGAAHAQTPSFTDVTEVTAVEVPVQVVLGGKPVRGLTQENFVVFHEKQKQAITGFEVVDLYTLPGEKAEEVPPAARRYFLFLFDLSFSEPKSTLQARKAAKDLLDDLHPADLVAVATYAASRGAELVLGFTPDRAQVIAALDNLGLNELTDRNGDPLKLVVDTLTGDMASVGILRQGSGLAHDVTREGPGAERREGMKADMKAEMSAWALSRLESFARESEQADLEVQKDKVTALTRSFSDLARLMRSVEGRKHVVYLSEGYDSSLIQGSMSLEKQKEMRESADKGEFWEISSAQRFGDSGAANDIDAMLQEFRRADCAIEAVDIGGLRAVSREGEALGYERTGGRASLLQLASDTGGDFYENFNDLSTAMGKMLERTGVTYVLTIQPETVPDGAYHALRVELKGVPKAARVVHRPGYFASKPFAQRSRMEKMIMTAGQVLAGDEGGQVLTSVLAVPLPAAKDAATADVPMLIEIDGPSLLHLHQGDDVPLEIYVYAMNEKGQVRDFLAQTLSLDLPKVDSRLLQAGLKFYGHLELPPGSYKARVLVRNGRTGYHGLRIVPVEVPATQAAGPVLLPPFFPEPKGEWLVTREAPREGRRDVPLPFRLGDRPFLPAATPILGERATRFALLGYNLAEEGELQVRSQVLTKDGREMQAGAVSVVGRTSGGEGEADRLELTFQPPGLQPGEYVLRVTVTDAAGKAGTASTPFVVAAANPGERS